MHPDRIAARIAARPAITYDDDLPVSARRAEIAQAIRDHQVVVVCGETGSGKTTQLPKICLELGRGAAGLIGHTQPRRIAARATAARIAQELKSELGKYVGFKIRFTDRVSDDTYIKLMTDGILQRGHGIAGRVRRGRYNGENGCQCRRTGKNCLHAVFSRAGRLGTTSRV